MCCVEKKFDPIPDQVKKKIKKSKHNPQTSSPNTSPKPGKISKEKS